MCALKWCTSAYHSLWDRTRRSRSRSRISPETGGTSEHVHSLARSHIQPTIYTFIIAAAAANQPIDHDRTSNRAITLLLLLKYRMIFAPTTTTLTNLAILTYIDTYIHTYIQRKNYSQWYIHTYEIRLYDITEKLLVRQKRRSTVQAKSAVDVVGERERRNQNKQSQGKLVKSLPHY